VIDTDTALLVNSTFRRRSFTRVFLALCCSTCGEQLQQSLPCPSLSGIVGTHIPDVMLRWRLCGGHFSNTARTAFRSRRLHITWGRFRGYAPAIRSPANRTFWPSKSRVHGYFSGRAIGLSRLDLWLAEFANLLRPELRDGKLKDKTALLAAGTDAGDLAIVCAVTSEAKKRPLSPVRNALLMRAYRFQRQIVGRNAKGR
jgi:hypothetical protein